MATLNEVISLMNEQENRLLGRMGEVHDEVRDTNALLTIQNGRLRKVEVKVAERDTYCAIKSESFKHKLEKVEPTMQVTRFLRTITKNPKSSIFIFITIIIATQSIVLIALEHQWLGKLIMLIKP